MFFYLDLFKKTKSYSRTVYLGIDSPNLDFPYLEPCMSTITILGNIYILPRRLSPSLPEPRRGVQLPNGRSLNQSHLWQNKMPAARATNGSRNGTTINRLITFWFQGATYQVSALVEVRQAVFFWNFHTAQGIGPQQLTQITKMQLKANPKMHAMRKTHITNKQMLHSEKNCQYIYNYKFRGPSGAQLLAGGLSGLLTSSFRPSGAQAGMSGPP